MKRKKRNWKVNFNGRETEVLSKTYGGACRKAFKKMKIQGPKIKQTQPQTDRDGSFVDVDVNLIT